MRFSRLPAVVLVCLYAVIALAAERPSVLLLPAMRTPDIPYLNRLHQAGFDIDYGLRQDDPLTWDRLRQFNVLMLTSLPTDESGHRWRQPPFRQDFAPLLERFLAAGGGVFVLLDTHEQLTSPNYETWNEYLARWGAALPLEGIADPATQVRHPHTLQPFVYTANIAPSPVSEGVGGIWFPNATGSGNCNFKSMTSPLIVDDSWQVVVRGAATSSTFPLKAGFALRANEHFTPVVRDEPVVAPPLFAIRQDGPGRLALTIENPVFHVVSGSSWAHDGAMLDKGLAKRPSDFGKLLENTLTWLAQPSLENGKLGGYRQEPLILKHPHFRRAPADFFPDFNSYQNPVPPAPVRRGLIGARTAYSGGTGTVADYAAAARRAGLDFVVFLETFTELTEDELHQLEADCAANSGADLTLLAGYTMATNVGNHIFFFGRDNVYPKGPQLTADGRELRLQNFDKDGNLTTSDEAAKNMLWQYTRGPRNIGYFDFANSDPGSIPVRNLRLYGLLGVMTYIDGKLVEDVTGEYLKLTPQGNPPRLCAVDLVASPAALEAAVKDGHYLTRVAVQDGEDVMGRMVYGHQYGRDNVYPSSGPRIHAWAWTNRVMTFAGEPFVTSRYRMPQLAKVSSDVGIRELRIYADGRLYRRLLLDGVKEYEHTFQWAFDRQRGFVLEVVDVNGGRAVSCSFETWTDSNALSWCSDRQNGELWHGPFNICPVWGSGVLTWYSVGHTWDGGGALTPFAGINLDPFPAYWRTDGRNENYRGHMARAMEGYTRATCIDDTVRNLAGDAWNVYAPGAVINAYHTLGPIRPAEEMRYRLRRTLYLPRKAGPLLDWHAMWSERAGGGLALFSGEMTMLKDLDLREIMATSLRTINFDDDRVGIWAVRTSDDTPPICGPMDTIIQTNRYLRPELGRGKSVTRIPIDRGGYIGAFGLKSGTPSAVFNLDARGIAWEPSLQRVFLRDTPATVHQGDTFTWQLLYLWDDPFHDARNLARLEQIRHYYGLDGRGDSGIQVSRGKLLDHFGIVDLEAVDGVVEFEIPQPDFALDMPLPLRFHGFNPNWTVGQYQIVGYTTNYYTNGRNVWRNLGPDDEDLVHLGVYTHGVPLHHSVVGHPVQCDAPEIMIQVTHLGDQPQRWYVAVNNPTDHPVQTTLRKTIDLPGFDFPDTPVQLAPGGYQVVLDEVPPPPPPVKTRIVERKADFFSQVPRGDGQALHVDFRGQGVVAWQGGAHANFTEHFKATGDAPVHFRVSFDARHLGGADRLTVLRPWGGSKCPPVRLGPEWATHTVDVECDPRWEVHGLIFTPATGIDAVPGVFELDNVDIHLLDADGNPTGDNLVVNGTFETGLDGWISPLLERYTEE